MTVELDNVISIGNVAVAALVQRITHCSDRMGAFSVCCIKRPVALLIHRNGVITAFEIDGQHIDPDDFELRYPGHRPAFERLAIINVDSPRQ